MLEALVAPRGLLVIENSGIGYLGLVSTYWRSVAGRLVYEALGGKDGFGFSQPSLMVFMNRFLLNQSSVVTDVFKTDGKFHFTLSNRVGWNTTQLV
ncbi:hypothetical protein BDZ45DRAFT_749626 [Acephala macrosclerotiorum]|nr:hypothetical protein BDZ45DRAFT_749626 [Acephala macrosclerotiorum]